MRARSERLQQQEEGRRQRTRHDPNQTPRDEWARQLCLLDQAIEALNRRDLDEAESFITEERCSIEQLDDVLRELRAERDDDEHRRDAS